MTGRVDFQSRAPIGYVRIGDQNFPVMPSPEMVRQLRVVRDSVNAVESGLTASEITFVPAGSVAATNLQAAVEEVDSEKATAASLTSHTTNTSNPHSVTKAQVGLSNVDNTSDANKPVSTATQTALDLKADEADLGTIASQDANNVAITGGAIDSTAIGAVTPDTGKFSSVESTGYVKSGSTVVGSLPSAVVVGAGARYFVTDANATTFLSVVAGGGANSVPVVSDGTNWLIG